MNKIYGRHSAQRPGLGAVGDIRIQFTVFPNNLKAPPANG